LARDAARDDISRREIPSADAAEIAMLWNSRPVSVENRSRIVIPFNEGHRLEAAGKLKAQGDPADPGADLDRAEGRKIAHAAPFFLGW
jgi:hypothetical protein